MKFILKKDKLFIQKKMYLVLVVLLAIGCLVGLVFPCLLTVDNKELLKTSISSFFNNVMNNKLDYKMGLMNSFISNFSLLFGIWLLGISIIGIPIILILLVYKGFIFGFSISSIIQIYGIKGVIGAITYSFPGSILSLITILLLSFYGVSFSIKLFKYLFLKENLNFKLIMNKYLKILAISCVSFLLISLSDVYLAPQFMKLFTFLLK